MKLADRRTQTPPPMLGTISGMQSTDTDAASKYGPPPQYPIESVDNALRLLLLFETQPSIRLTDASNYLGVASSTAHRLMGMLLYRGFVRQNPATRAYEPGQALSSIAFAIRRQVDIRTLARPVLEQLFQQTGETVHFARLERTDAQFLVLSFAGQSVTVIGLLVSLANSAVLAGSLCGSWLRKRGNRISLLTGLLAAGVGLAAAGPLAGVAVAAAVALTVSGVGAGILQTVGPAIAADEVHPEDRGDALALTGTVRAAALFLTPCVMALLVSVIPVAAALVTAGVLITLPAARGNPRKDSPKQSRPPQSAPGRPRQQDQLEAPQKEVSDEN